MRNLILASVACSLFASAAAMAQGFTFTTLDNMKDPTFNQLLGINDDGTIVGYFGSGQAGHPNRGYEISPPYTEYTARNQPGSIQTQATGINNSGLITGFWSDTNSGTDNNFAVFFVPETANLLSLNAINPKVGKTAGVPEISQALGINNSNVVAGFYIDAAGKSHGYTYNLSGIYTPINIPGATSVTATGINDSGEVCGFYVNAKGHTLGFVRNGTSGVVTTFGVPGFTNVQLLGINNSGIAVGFYADAANVPHGLYYSSSTGSWTQVDDPAALNGTVLNGLNNQNQLVGFYTDAANLTHGMLVTVAP